MFELNRFNDMTNISFENCYKQLVYQDVTLGLTCHG